MSNVIEPTVGQWYLRHDKGEMFRVVALDASASAVEIQNFDGDVEELDMDAWRELNIEPTGAPEDWTGPFDDIEPDDRGYTETAMSPRDWRQSVEAWAQSVESWRDARVEEREEESEAWPVGLHAEISSALTASGS